MTTIRSLLDFDAGDIGANIFAWLILLVVVPTVQWAYRTVMQANRKWSLRWSERELAQLLRLQGQPAAVTEFLLSRGLWALMLLGVGMMFLPLGDTEAGKRMLMVINMILGTGIYAITLSGLATIHHLRRSPEKQIERLTARIEQLKGNR